MSVSLKGNLLIFGWTPWEQVLELREHPHPLKICCRILPICRWRKPTDALLVYQSSLRFRLEKVLEVFSVQCLSLYNCRLWKKWFVLIHWGVQYVQAFFFFFLPLTLRICLLKWRESIVEVEWREKQEKERYGIIQREIGSCLLSCFMGPDLINSCCQREEGNLSLSHHIYERV